MTAGPSCLAKSCPVSRLEHCCRLTFREASPSNANTHHPINSWNVQRLEKTPAMRRLKSSTGPGRRSLWTAGIVMSGLAQRLPPDRLSRLSALVNRTAGQNSERMSQMVQ